MGDASVGRKEAECMKYGHLFILTLYHLLGTFLQTALPLPVCVSPSSRSEITMSDSKVRSRI